MRTVLILVCILLGTFHLPAQKSGNVFTVVFYNTDNLYDTIDSPGTDDATYSPKGTNTWNSSKYHKKINDLGKVLGSVAENEPPEIIGLAGIENMTVLRDLLKTDFLKKTSYGIVHKDSPDPKGMDVAMLFRKDEFALSGEDLIHVTFPFDSTLRIPAILHVYGKLSDGKDVHFFINHWISRDEARKGTETARMYCAVALRRSIDMVLSRDNRARIIIMGDFNDEPTNKSLMSVLQASNKRKNQAVGEFYNLFYDQHNLNPSGTYYSEGGWKMFSQVIVSWNLLSAVEGYRCSFESAHVFKKEGMLYKTDKGEELPYRTYDGIKYIGGPGEHLPVILTLSKP